MGSCLSTTLQVVVAVANATSTATPTDDEPQQQQQQQQSDSGHQQQQQPSAGGGGGGGGALSPVYASLPPDAKRYLVRNVYDGDTLTLVENETRVRLLGVDTPELKEQQPYSEQAKQYTRNLCHKKYVYVSYEPNGGEQKDHYGRHLAFVWVENNNNTSNNGSVGFICVNEGLIAEGYATAYAPGGPNDKKLHNWDKLVALQSQARQSRMGMWSTFQNRQVVKTSNGSAFHIRSCQHLADVKRLTELSEIEAMDQGLHPCRTCLS